MFNKSCSIENDSNSILDLKNETYESLLIKCNEFKDNLVTVQENLRCMPNDPELIQLVKNLNELISLYQDLIDLKKSESTKETDENLSASLKNQLCYVPYKNELQIAKVLGVEENLTCSVELLKINYVGNFFVSDIKIIPPLSANQCHIGKKCWAFVALENNWKPVTIIEKLETLNKILVCVDNTLLTFETNLDCLAADEPNLSKKVVNSKSDYKIKKVQEVKETTTAGGYRIPEALKINPQDNDKIKQIKKRKIQLIKKEQRKKMVEEEAQARKNNWKAHSATAIKKNFRLQKDSIFSTSDAFDAKVGVTNSGTINKQFYYINSRQGNDEFYESNQARIQIFGRRSINFTKAMSTIKLTDFEPAYQNSEKQKTDFYDTYEASIDRLLTIASKYKREKKIESKKPESSSNLMAHNNITTKDSTSDSKNVLELQNPVNNGGSTPEYTWVQTLDNVDVYLPLKSNNGKLSIVLKADEFLILVGSIPLYKKNFSKKIRSIDSFWTIEDSNVLHLYLEKAEKLKWWDSVFLGDPKIDLQKIQPENSNLSDLDSDLRQTVEKMLLDQNKGQQNFSNSRASDQQNFLNEFKKQHPEFDFSNANINWGSN